MSRSYTLSATHYAAGWVVPDDDNFNVRTEVNDLAIRYAKLPDGPDKEAAFLKLVECFHGYLIKYTNMVIRGQLPNPTSRVGKDAAEMLKKLLPRGSNPDQTILSKTCHTLHLAFKTMTTDDIYDAMVMCFLRACRRYDPLYTDKVRQVCEVLDGKTFFQQFTADAVSSVVGFDAVGCIRLLVRKQYLVSVVGNQRKVVGYRRGPSWPPQQTFFESGPIGFTYFAAMWFRYYLAEHIVAAMGELESREGVLQLDRGITCIGKVSSHEDFAHSSDALPHADGNFVDQHGTAWAADTSLMEAQLDISEMTDGWVRQTSDKLFRNLTTAERWLLQMIFRKEFNWVQISAMLQCSTQTARQQYSDVMKYLRGHVGVPEAIAA